MNKGLLLVVILVLGGALLGVLLLVLGPGEATEEIGGAAAAPGMRAEAPDSDPEEGERRTGPVDLLDAGGVLEEEVARSLVEGDGAAAPYQEQPEDGVVVRVVARDGERAVPRATVYVLEDGVPPNGGMGARSRVSAYLARGLRYRADSEGIARIPRAEVSRPLAAGGSEMWGATTVSATDDEVVLHLDPDPSLEVRVVDADGDPVADVPVSIRLLMAIGRNAATARTDARGRARFEYVGSLLAELAPLGSAAVGFAFPHSPAVLHLLEGSSVPDRPIELVLPATAPLEVVVLDEGGAVRADSSIVWLYPDEDAEFTRLASRTKDGVARFPFVGLGLDLDLRIAVEDGREATQVRDRGPERAGELRSITVKISDDVPLVSGVVVDADGAPIADADLQLHVRTRDAARSKTTRSTVRTDRTGRFRGVVLGELEAGAQRQLEVRQGTDQGVLSARVDLTFPLRIGENDVGRLALLPLPLLADGRVVDDLGAPVHAAKVQLWHAAPTSREGPIHWVPVSGGATTVSDSDGLFELRGYEEGGALAVSATRAGYVSTEKVPFAPGARGLVVPLMGAGEIAGSVLLDDGIGPEAIQYKVLHGGTGASLPVVQARLADGNFTLSGIPIGSHTVALSVAGLRDDLFVVEGVVVRSDEVTRDPRLQDIDLRGAVRSIRVSANNVDGDPVEGSRIAFRPAGQEGAAWTTRWTGRSSSVELLTTHSAVDIEVSADGYRAVRLEGVVSDQEVVLHGGLRLRFVLEGARPPLPENFTYVVTLNPSDPNGVRTQLSGEFDEAGETTVIAPRPGTYRVYASLRKRGVGRARTHGMSRPQFTIEIEDAATDQVFGLTLDADEVDATVVRIQGG